jgi:hypothetical protein
VPYILEWLDIAPAQRPRPHVVYIDTFYSLPAKSKPKSQPKKAMYFAKFIGKER